MNKEEATQVLINATGLLVDAVLDKDVPSCLTDVLNAAHSQLDDYKEALKLFGVTI